MNKKVKILIFMLLFLLVGFLTYFRYLYVSTRSEILTDRVNMEVVLVGFIDDEPNDFGFRKRVVINIKEIQIGKDLVSIEKEQKIRVLASCSDKVCEIGKRVRVSGKLLLPEVTDEFDSNLFLLARGIQFEMKNAKIFVEHDVKSDVENNLAPETNLLLWNYLLKRKLYQFRNILVENIRAVISDKDEFALGSGILITGKGEMSKESLEHFKRAGLVHMVVLSGFNVSIVSQVIISCLSFLPKLLSGIFGTIGIILFCLMVGGGSTVIRSLIMSLIGIYSRIFNIEHTALRATIIAGVLMIIFNPLILIGDPSFQLSFACTLGLVLLGNSTNYFFDFLPAKFGLRETVSSFFATQIFALPLLLKFSGAISLYGIFANLAVVPFIPLAMLLVFLASVLCFISVDIAMLFGLVSHFVLGYFMWVVRSVSGIENALLNLGKASNYFIVAWYIVFIPLSTFLYKKFINYSS